MVQQHVMLVSRDAGLVDEVRRLCAMAGQSLQVAADVGDVTRLCRQASLAVIDDDAIDIVGETLRGHSVEVVLLTDDARRLATWEAAVGVGARRVLTRAVDDVVLLELLALSSEPAGSPGPLLAVLGGSGGIGASTVAVALSWAVAESRRPVTLVDLDPLGGGLDVALGLERADGLRWRQLCGTRGVVATTALREQLPRAGGVAVLSAAAPVTDAADVVMPDRAAVASVLDATRRGGGVVVADLPRWPSDTTDAVIADCSVALLVVAAEVRGVAAAATCVRRLKSLGVDLRLVLHADSRSRLHARDVGGALGLDHLATLRHESGLSPATDRGEVVRWLPRSRLGRTAKQMAAELLVDTRNE